ncbi:MAG: hypothetical protein QY304_02745 [Candidatus Paceibacterota bacterium]|nr:MAG: hypothetical protein QY304_02745 [Candidatus Paceibacterota bacterium]
MIIALFGNDYVKKNRRLADLIREFQEKTGSNSVLRFVQDNFSRSEIENLIKGQGLFEKQIIAVFDQIFSVSEFRDLFLESVLGFSESPNVFVLLETEEEKKLTEVLKGKAKIEKMDLPEIRPFNLYSLSDAFGRRDRKKFWILFLKAQTAGFTPEEILGVLFWQVKNILIVLDSKNEAESGLKSFPYKKAKEFSKNFSAEDLKKLSSGLNSLYHEAHLGKIDFLSSLEKFILKI